MNNFLVVLLFSLFVTFSYALQVSYDERALTIDGTRRLIISGAIHYPRSTPEMWPDLIKKAKDGGLNAIETYVFWNAHEPERRKYDFSENLDLVRFIKTIQEQGMYAILRIGPYVCAEWNYGGLPVWLHNIQGVKFRTDNELFKDEMKVFTTLVVEKMKHNRLFGPQGGPIILAQIENEYGDVINHYGEEGKQYLQWCAKLAQSFKVGVPWIMCKQDNVLPPSPMIVTYNNYYGDGWNPKQQGVPKMWTENWIGWFKKWGDKNPHRTARDVSFAVARFYQRNGTLQNYYMYHGGTNFGRSSGGPYITTSYDYDAPIDEYGNLNNPKWCHLKQLHNILLANERILVNGFYRNTEYNKYHEATSYSFEGKEFCFFSNWNTSDATINYNNKPFIVPAWSVTVSPDCNTEAYNTAKVNCQHSTMVKRSKEDSADDGDYETTPLVWSWVNEEVILWKSDGKVIDSNMTSSNLLDQKVVTNDTTDYLWYVTSFEKKKNDSISDNNTYLHVQTKGHALHAFVNGQYLDSKWSKGEKGNYGFTLEKKISLSPGNNKISLLSITMGLPNYGGGYDDVEVGVHGPVKLLIGNTNNGPTTIDLSKTQWEYKVGLIGYKDKLYDPLSPNAAKFKADGLPTNRMLMWYKTTFDTPIGTDPVVVDLKGLGKGHAWVNGRSIGRYWSDFLAQEDGCSSDCDYRGTYSPSHCQNNCGRPTQRWYHVPRSYLGNNGKNTLVLFEENGGNPYNVKIQTVTIGKVCGNVIEGNTLELTCQGGKVMTNIKFASFGLPEGECGSFKKPDSGGCESSTAKSFIKTQCLGKDKCVIDVSEKTLGITGCKATNRLAIEMECRPLGDMIIDHN